jgi:hypothetical protein
MTKKILAVVGIILALVVVGGGAFYGGMLFQQRQATSASARFFADRGGGAGGNGAGGNGGFAGGGIFGGGTGGNGAGRGAVGQIKSIDGDTLTVSTPQSEVKVKLTDTTSVLKVVAGERTELQVGDQVVVRGDRDASGNVTATTVQITNNPTPTP